MIRPLGSWSGGAAAVTFEPQTMASQVQAGVGPFHVVRDPAGRVGLGVGGAIEPAGTPAGHGFECLAALPAFGPEILGDPAFRAAHGLRYAYLGGGMARGIGSTALVIALARHGMLGFFGAAGLELPRVEAAIETLKAALADAGTPWGVNLIHTPDDPAKEEALVDLLLAAGVRRVEAAAFVGLTPALARYAFTGLEPDEHGGVRRKHHVFAKVSRAEVARHFLAPAPAPLLERLVASGGLTAAEAGLAARTPVAAALTVEADSGGHTDNRPMGPAFSSVFELGQQLAREHSLDVATPIGVAGGLGTPHALAAAFGLGASYVLLGSVHQACVESGTSDLVREMLAQAGIADVAMTSSADMFERGIRVQVLKRGTMMPQRGNHLFDLYRRHASLDDLTESERANLEKNVFRAPLEEIWARTRTFLERVDPGQIPVAARDPRKRMALVFRWYLGKSSQWALAGDASRRLDLQIWCGPAMGAFNDWTRESFLAEPAQRFLGVVASNLIHGAAAVARAQLLRALGVPLPPAAFRVRPREAAQLP